MSSRHDLVVIGAGPAGLAAAIEAAGLGLSVRLLDEQPAPGGQIYREVESVAHRRPGDLGLFGDDYRRGASLVAAFRETAAIDYRPAASVWQVMPDGGVGVTLDGRAVLTAGRRVLVATGAYERPVPVPGWTLPGVMTAGAAQVLLKSAGTVPGGRVVIAGSGPLMLLVAGQLVRAGAEVAAVLETTRWRDYLAAIPCLPRALRGFSDLARGAGMRRALHRAGVTARSGIGDLAALGDGGLRRVRYVWRGSPREIAADTLLLHEGVVPDTQITRQAGCGHEWCADQRHWRPVVDGWGNTSLERIMVAGDGGGIGGARVAEIAGRLAALEAARALNVITEGERDHRAVPLWRERSRYLAIRPLLDRLFRPAPWIAAPADDGTVVCRCEEVTAGALREAVALGCPGPNQLKAFTRCGMGPCQGRLCGLTAAEIIARARRVPVAEVGYFRLRPPIRPVTLGELAAIDDTAETAG